MRHSRTVVVRIVIVVLVGSRQRQCGKPSAEVCLLPPWRSAGRRKHALCVQGNLGRRILPLGGQDSLTKINIRDRGWPVFVSFEGRLVIKISGDALFDFEDENRVFECA